MLYFLSESSQEKFILGLNKLKNDFPLSLRLLRDIHKILLWEAEQPHSLQVNFGAHKTGSEAQGQETRSLFRRLWMLCNNAS